VRCASEEREQVVGESKSRASDFEKIQASERDMTSTLQKRSEQEAREFTEKDEPSAAVESECARDGRLSTYTCG